MVSIDWITKKRSAVLGVLAILAIAVICLVLFQKSKDDTVPAAGENLAAGENATIAESNSSPAATAVIPDSPPPSTQSVSSPVQTLLPTPDERGETNSVVETSELDAAADDSMLIAAPPYRALSPTPQSPRPTPATTARRPEGSRDSSEP